MNGAEGREREVSALAFLIVAERDRSGNSHWDTDGVASEVRGLLAGGAKIDTVLAVGASAARDGNANTPAGMRWSQHAAATAAVLMPEATGPRCSICGDHEPRCRRRRYSQHEFDPSPRLVSAGGERRGSDA